MFVSQIEDHDEVFPKIHRAKLLLHGFLEKGLNFQTFKRQLEGSKIKNWKVRFFELYDNGYLTYKKTTQVRYLINLLMNSHPNFWDV